MTDFIDVRHPQAHTSCTISGFIVARQPQAPMSCAISDYRCQSHQQNVVCFPTKSIQNNNFCVNIFQDKNYNYYYFRIL